MKIAVLSNVNMTPVERLLGSAEGIEVYHSEGYGNLLGTLLDPESSFHAFAPEVTFLFPELMEILEHDSDRGEALLESWFQTLESAISSAGTFYIADGYLWGAEIGAYSEAERYDWEARWNQRLRELAKRRANVRIFPYHRTVAALGEENAFSLKMWYLGKILHTTKLHERLAEGIREKLRIETYLPKKVLVLDLDNTLWGGLAGEADVTPIVLSDDGKGLCYRNLQRVIRQMKEKGVILAIASKNNPEDAEEILEKNSYMVLKPDDFSAKRINWNPKNVSLSEMAKELNLGLDSFVFFDDSPSERALIREILPEVSVPEFPERVEELASSMSRIYREYFEKPVLTKEDLEKTKQYADQAKREELRSSAVSFEEYLESLQVKITREDPVKNQERLLALMNKTNQFNLTTKRFAARELQKLLEDSGKKVYLYRVEDRFGDYGMVSALIVDCEEAKASLTEFVLSCRAMGKRVESRILKELEEDLREAGYGMLQTMYLPTAKNKPVENLFEAEGYELVKKTPDGEKYYQKML